MRHFHQVELVLRKFVYRNELPTQHCAPVVPPLVNILPSGLLISLLLCRGGRVALFSYFGLCIPAI